MNEDVLQAGGEEGFDETLGAWGRLDELRMPVHVAVGEFDASFVQSQSRHVAEYVANGTLTLLQATAHLPYLDDPDQVSELLAGTVGEDRR